MHRKLSILSLIIFVSLAGCGSPPTSPAGEAQINEPSASPTISSRAQETADMQETTPASAAQEAIAALQTVIPTAGSEPAVMDEQPSMLPVSTSLPEVEAAVEISQSPIMILNEHIKDVTALAFHPNGKVLASGSHDEQVLLWDLTTGEPYARITSFTSSVRDLAYSPDGTLLASLSDDGLRVWNPDESTVAPVVQLTDQYHEALAWSPDGTTIAVASSPALVQLWNVKDRAKIAQFEGHADVVTDVAWSPNGRELASASRDGTVRIWQVADGTVRTMLYHEGGFGSVGWSPDGQHIAAASGIWSAADGALELELPVGVPIYSPDGATLVSGNNSAQFAFWNTRNGSLRYQLDEGVPSSGLSYAFSPDGRLFAAGLTVGFGIYIWQVPPTPDADSEQTATESNDTRQDAGPLRSLDIGATEYVFSPDGTMLAGNIDKGLGVWNVESGVETMRLTPPYQWPDPYYEVAWSPDGKRLIAVDEFYKSSYGVWDAATGNPIERVDFPDGILSDFAMSPDFSLSAGIMGDSREQRIDLIAGDGSIVRSLTYENDDDISFTKLAWSPDGTTIVGGVGSGYVVIWNVADGRVLNILDTVNGGAILDLAWSPDGRWIAAAASRDTWLWEAGKGAKGRTIPECSRPIAWSPDSRRLACGGQEEINIWDSKEDSLLFSLSAVNGATGIDWSPKGDLIAVWDVEGHLDIWGAQR